MPDTNVHKAIIELIISYAVVGVFVFTAITACLSMVFPAIIPDPKVRRNLFTLLILEIVAGCLGVFFNIFNFNPKKAQDQVEAPLVANISALAEQKQTLATTLDETKGQVVELAREKTAAIAQVQEVRTVLAERENLLAVKEKEVVTARQTFGQQLASLQTENVALKAKQLDLQQFVQRRDEEIAVKEMAIREVQQTLAAREQEMQKYRVLATELDKTRSELQRVQLQAELVKKTERGKK